MSEEKNAELMHALIKALEENDTEKALSLCTEDIIFVSPVGTFEGKNRVGNYFNWMVNTMQGINFTKTGVEFIVKGDKGVDENIVRGVHEGEEVELLSICTYQFSNGKIKEMRETFDRLTIAEQAVKGWLPKKMVGVIAQKSREGLD